MALKFFPRRSTTLQAFLREYNLSVCYCTHPSLTRALGIFYSTPSHYVFAQEAGLYGDLYAVIVSEVSKTVDLTDFNFTKMYILSSFTYPRVVQKGFRLPLDNHIVAPPLQGPGQWSWFSPCAVTEIMMMLACMTSGAFFIVTSFQGTTYLWLFRHVLVVWSPHTLFSFSCQKQQLLSSALIH